MHGEFTWIDLSTFDVTQAVEFYRSVFHWDVEEDVLGYLDCSVSGDPCAGIFEMPELFQKIGMPSFWMTYISVEDITSAVAKARQLGGRIELEQTDARGKIALIRDPAGAGFTCYEGAAKSAIASKPEHGRWLWSELFVSDLSRIKVFYEELFLWRFEPDVGTPDRQFIRNNRGDRIGAVQVASNDMKGEKEFWAVFFAVDDARTTISAVSGAGGQVVYDYPTSDGRHFLATDPQGAAFFVTQTPARVR